jgi:hypothetical protein
MSGQVHNSFDRQPRKAAAVVLFQLLASGASHQILQQEATQVVVFTVLSETIFQQDQHVDNIHQPQQQQQVAGR